MELPFDLQLTLLVLSSIFIPIACKLYVVLIWKPLAIQNCFKRQGIGGPQRHLLYGTTQEMKNIEQEAIEKKPIEGFSHDIASRVLPAYHEWSKRYGELFLFWFGADPRLCVTDADMIREMLTTKFGLFTKDDPAPAVKALLGKGLVLVTDEKWVQHRRIINPAFHVDRLKGMTKTMASCTISMLSTWTHENKELEVHEQLKQLTANIISHTAFGSSYPEGKEVFKAQEELILMAVATLGDISVPGLQHLPTKRNRQMWKLEKRARDTLKFIINSRTKSAEEAGGFGEDLLGMMMESSRGDGKTSMSLDEIMDECMTFFFAGHETTTNLLTWAMFLLSIYPDWQTKLRQEVMDLCGTGTPDADMLGKLKLTTMFLMETLRLYPPVLLMLRKTTKELKLGNVLIPKDVTMILPIFMVHRKPEYWGEDADEFNPLRFSQGLSRAGKHPNAILPFSFGPRVCVGQNFAMMEGKLVLAMILQRFSFSLSPGYKHAPVRHLTLQPKFGLPILLQPLHV